MSDDNFNTHTHSGGVLSIEFGTRPNSSGTAGSIPYNKYTWTTNTSVDYDAHKQNLSLRWKEDADNISSEAVITSFNDYPEWQKRDLENTIDLLRQQIWDEREQAQINLEKFDKRSIEDEQLLESLTETIETLQELLEDAYEEIKKLKENNLELARIYLKTRNEFEEYRNGST